jgi:hypothetical protein
MLDLRYGMTSAVIKYPQDDGIPKYAAATILDLHWIPLHLELSLFISFKEMH